MLDCRGHNPPRFCSRESDGNGFACAAGENYMVMPAQRCSNPGPSVLECGTCRPAIGMRRRGIGPAFKCAQHCFPSLRQYGRGGGMIEIKTTGQGGVTHRSEEHTSELQSLMRISYAVFCLKKKKQTTQQTHETSIRVVI